jgi:hypothetical protein
LHGEAVSDETRRLEEARRHADATGGEGGTHQQAIDHARAAERHANGAAKLIEDYGRGEPNVELLMEAREAARRAEREALMCRGMLALPGPLVPADERAAALKVVADVLMLMDVPMQRRLGNRVLWLEEVIARDLPSG